MTAAQAFGKVNLERTIMQLVAAGRGTDITRKLASSGSLYLMSDEVRRAVVLISVQCHTRIGLYQMQTAPACRFGRCLPSRLM
jgi:hypothetical protein